MNAGAQELTRLQTEAARASHPGPAQLQVAAALGSPKSREACRLDLELKLAAAEFVASAPDYTRWLGTYAHHLAGE